MSVKVKGITVAGNMRTDGDVSTYLAIYTNGTYLIQGISTTIEDGTSVRVKFDIDAPGAPSLGLDGGVGSYPVYGYGTTPVLYTHIKANSIFDLVYNNESWIIVNGVHLTT